MINVQRELMTDRLRKYLKDNYDLTEEQLLEICDREDGDPRFDSLVDDLSMKECDDSDKEKELGRYPDGGGCATELIDIIFGPYEPLDDEEIGF